MWDFKQALEANGLFDLGWKGMKFTWNNIHSDDTFTKLRLDRTVATKEWIEKVGNQKTEVLSSTRSYYVPILISTGDHLGNAYKKVKIFRFEVCWIKHESVELVIQEA